MSFIRFFRYQLLWPSILFPRSSNAFRFCCARSLALAPAPSLFSREHLYSMNTPPFPSYLRLLVSPARYLYSAVNHVLFFSRSRIRVSHVERMTSELGMSQYLKRNQLHHLSPPILLDNQDASKPRQHAPQSRILTNPHTLCC